MREGVCNCELCGALVCTALMPFHSEWHAAQAGRGTHFFKLAPETDEVDLNRLLQVAAALGGLPEVSARPKFVADLRNRLIAEALNAGIAQAGAPGPSH